MESPEQANTRGIAVVVEVILQSQERSWRAGGQGKRQPQHLGAAQVLLLLLVYFF